MNQTQKIENKLFNIALNIRETGISQEALDSAIFIQNTAEGNILTDEQVGQIIKESMNFDLESQQSYLSQLKKKRDEKRRRNAIEDAEETIRHQANTREIMLLAYKALTAEITMIDVEELDAKGDDFKMQGIELRRLEYEQCKTAVWNIIKRLDRAEMAAKRSVAAAAAVLKAPELTAEDAAQTV